MATVDQAFVEQPHERGADRPNMVRIHGEHVARPVGGRAQLAQLGVDDLAVGFHPFPHLIQKLLASEIVAIDAFGPEISLDDELPGDARVVTAGHPQAGVAEHAVPADHDVLQGDEQRVAVVQPASHIGRRHGNDKGRSFAEVRVRLRAEQIVLEPEVVPARLSVKRVVGRVRLVGGTAGGGRHTGLVAQLRNCRAGWLHLK